MLKKYSIYIFYIVVVFFYNCSTQSSYQIKSFFFDGVPNPNAVTFQDSVVNIAVDTIVVVNEALNELPTPIDGSIHIPYKERKCFECHDENNRTKAKYSLNVLCFTCHEGFNKTYPVTHGPTEFGACTMCHSPHKSKEVKLLYSVKQDLCLQCHEQKDVFSNSFHSEIGEQSCIECHNPHGGENRKFLNEKACFQCHNKIIENRSLLHGPVSAGQCAMCHTSHDGNSPKLLVATGNTLCLNCHNTEDIYGTNYHVKKKNQLCLQCHDPHGSNEPNLIINP